MRPLNTGTCRFFQDELEQNRVPHRILSLFAGWLVCIYNFRLFVFHFAHWLDDTCCVALDVASHLMSQLFTDWFYSCSATQLCLNLILIFFF